MKKEVSRKHPAGTFYVNVMVDNAELAERLFGVLRRELQSYKRENKDCTYMLEMDRCATAAEDEPKKDGGAA